jgi:hypothetical protein
MERYQEDGDSWILRVVFRWLTKRSGGRQEREWLL